MEKKQLISENEIAALKEQVATDPEGTVGQINFLKNVVASLEVARMKAVTTKNRTEFYETIKAQIESYGLNFFCLPVDDFLTNPSTKTYASLFVVMIKNWPYLIGMTFKSDKWINVSRLNNCTNEIEDFSSYDDFKTFVKENLNDEIE